MSSPTPGTCSVCSRADAAEWNPDVIYVEDTARWAQRLEEAAEAARKKAERS